MDSGFRRNDELGMWARNFVLASVSAPSHRLLSSSLSSLDLRQSRRGGGRSCECQSVVRRRGAHTKAPAVAALGNRSAPDSWAGIGHDGLSACFSPVSPARQSKPPRGVAVRRRRALAHAPCLTLGPFRPDRGPVVVPAGGCRCLPTAWVRTTPAGATSGRCRMFPISATPKSLLRNWSPPVGAPSTSKDAMKIMRPAGAGTSG
jgi:hypothetical protein